MPKNVEVSEEVKTPDWMIPTRKDLEEEFQKHDIEQIVQECGFIIIKTERGTKAARRVAQLRAEDVREHCHEAGQQSSTSARVWYIATGSLSAAASLGAAFAPALVSPMGLFSKNAAEAAKISLNTGAGAANTAQRVGEMKDGQEQTHIRYLVEQRSAEIRNYQDLKQDPKQNIDSAISIIQRLGEEKGRMIQTVFSS